MLYSVRSLGLLYTRFRLSSETKKVHGFVYQQILQSRNCDTLFIWNHERTQSTLIWVILISHYYFTAKGIIKTLIDGKKSVWNTSDALRFEIRNLKTDIHGFKSKFKDEVYINRNIVIELSVLVEMSFGKVQSQMTVRRMWLVGVDKSNWSTLISLIIRT